MSATARVERGLPVHVTAEYPQNEKHPKFSDLRQPSIWPVIGIFIVLAVSICFSTLALTVSWKTYQARLDDQRVIQDYSSNMVSENGYNTSTFLCLGKIIKSFCAFLCLLVLTQGFYFSASALANCKFSKNMLEVLSL